MIKRNLNIKSKSFLKSEYMIGIDPGTKGGIGLLEKNNNSYYMKEVFEIPNSKKMDMKIFNKETGRYGREVDKVDFKELDKIIKNFSKYTDKCTFEETCGFDKQKASYAFNFGFACGGIFSICEFNNLDIGLVDPMIWKRDLKIPGKKDWSGKFIDNIEEKICEHTLNKIKNCSREDFIKYDNFYKENRVKDGLCESLLIALWGMSK